MCLFLIVIYYHSILQQNLLRVDSNAVLLRNIINQLRTNDVESFVPKVSDGLFFSSLHSQLDSIGGFHQDLVQDQRNLYNNIENWTKINCTQERLMHKCLTQAQILISESSDTKLVVQNNSVFGLKNILKFASIALYIR